MPTLSQRWETAPASSCPVCLPRVDPDFFTSLLAEGCQQPPKVSATSGRKAKPCLLHVSSAPSSFPLWAWSQSQPWGPDLDGGGDFHVQAASLPPVQLDQDQDVSWAPILPGKEEAAFLHWSKACCNSNVKESIDECVVPANPLPPEPQRRAWFCY